MCKEAHYSGIDTKYNINSVERVIFSNAIYEIYAIFDGVSFLGFWISEMLRNM